MYFTLSFYILKNVHLLNKYLKKTNRTETLEMAENIY